MKEKKFVCLAINNQKGFSLISMLLALMIIFLSVPLLAQALYLVNHGTTYDELSMQQYTFTMRDEFALATDYYIKDNSLYLVKLDADQVNFYQLDDNLIRRVNGKGHEIFLRNIQNVEFTDVDYGVKIKLTSLEGYIYEKTIAFL